jgi:hypothetical protein
MSSMGEQENVSQKQQRGKSTDKVFHSKNRDIGRIWVQFNNISLI